MDRRGSPVSAQLTSRPQSRRLAKEGQSTNNQQPTEDCPMCLKQFAATLRAEALSAPMPYENEKGQTTFTHEKTTFRCLNTCAAITAMANRIEKNHKKNFSRTPLPQKRGTNRGSIPAVIRRFIADRDFHNVRELDALT